jgi:hypothetical protein
MAIQISDDDGSVAEVVLVINVDDAGQKSLGDAMRSLGDRVPAKKCAERHPDGPRRYLSRVCNLTFVFSYPNRRFEAQVIDLDRVTDGHWEEDILRTRVIR